MDQPFDMFELSADLVLEIRKHPSRPHRHEYEELLIITSGRPDNYIDFLNETVDAPVVIYVAQGKVHEFIPDPETRGWCIRYRNDIIPESNFHFYSNYLDRIAFAFNPGTCKQQIGILCELILSEFTHHPESPDIYRHLFLALLAKLETDGQHHLPIEQETRSPRQNTFKSFLSILERNYKRNEGVAFYADQMNTSVRNLNHLTSKVFGKSVSELIETRKLIEARRLLLGTSQTISEIGFALGYNEKSYFTRVFRKKTGITPSAFRATMQS
jgi:AraC-like DNA-binding protein